MNAVVEQPVLWDIPAPEPAPGRAKRRPTHAPRARRSEAAQAEECDPTCLVCGKSEGRGLCSPRCSVVCVHTRQPDRVEVCLVQVHVTAVLVAGVPGGRPGRRLALVCCPHCGQVHWHAPRYGVHYRVAACGAPYVVHLPRPRLAPGGTVDQA
ncbi:hypothetical protein [Microtetraspora malaysiensis]|uniref:RNHCP domain-containing protein n=1 Tax=Microtetraspora malaysiensis TaxID=161358 RepID=A0ABW6SKA9_9ACTN